MHKLMPLALTAALTTTAASARPFTPQDLVSLSRVASPAVSPDGRWLVWQQRETDLAANKGRFDLWRIDLRGKTATPEKFASLADANETDPAFGPDGQLYFLSDRKNGNSAVWRVAMTGGTATQVTGDHDLSGFKVSPKGDAILVWADRPVGAASLDVEK